MKIVLFVTSDRKEAEKRFPSKSIVLLVDISDTYSRSEQSY